MNAVFPAAIVPTCIGRLWGMDRTEFVALLEDHVKIHQIIDTTNAIEPLNAGFRRAVRTRGHVPNEQSEMKTLDLLVRSPDPKDTGSTPMGHTVEADAEHQHCRRSHVGGGEPLTMQTPLTPILRRSRAVGGGAFVLDRVGASGSFVLGAWTDHRPVWMTSLSLRG